MVWGWGGWGPRGVGNGVAVVGFGFSFCSFLLKDATFGICLMYLCGFWIFDTG